MKTRRQTGTITVRREDDGAEFELQVFSTFHEVREGAVVRELEDKLKHVASPDGRGIYTTNETHFFFDDEPDRPIRIVRAYE